MEKLLEDLKNYIKERNKELTPETVKYIISIVSIADEIYKIAKELKDDPDSVFNNIDDKIEEILLSNQENYQKSLKIINNVHNDVESIKHLKTHTFIYDFIKSLFLKSGFSEGLSHYYSLSITYEFLEEKSSKITSELTTDILSSYSDFELDSLKLKNKLSFSLIELATNKKFPSTRVEKFIESIEISKQIKSLNDKELACNSNLLVTDKTYSTEKSETLKSNLYENSFFEITKVKSLTHDGQSKLIDLLELNDTPYIIAMFDFLGYFKYLTNEHGLTNSKIHSKVGSWLNTNTQTIKCNMLVLNEKSALRENNRYTAHLHKEKVKTDYYSLK